MGVAVVAVVADNVGAVQNMFVPLTKDFGAERKGRGSFHFLLGLEIQTLHSSCLLLKNQ